MEGAPTRFRFVLRDSNTSASKQDPLQTKCHISNSVILVPVWKERNRVGDTICSIHTLLQDGFLVVLELPCGFLLGCVRDCFVSAYPCPVGNIAGIL